MASKGGLGTGLSALFEDNKTNTDSGQTLRITEILMMNQFQRLRNQ